MRRERSAGRRALGAPAAAFALAALAAPAARAHGPAPAPLGALAAGAGAPGLVRTSIGLAFARGDGTYAYGCPSAWGGGETALAAATADGALVVTVAGGVASRSTDGGCSFAPVGAETGLSFSDVVRLRGAVYLLGGGAPARAALVRVRAEGPAEVVAEFAGEGAEAFRPDGFAAFEGVGGAGLVLAGARPTPAARAAVVGDAPGEPVAVVSLGPVPAGPDVVRLAPRAASPSGEAWLVATEGRALRLVRGAPAGGAAPFSAPLAWAAEAAAHETLLGPAPLGGRWLVVRDGRLETAEQGHQYIPIWIDAGPVGWTCLSAVDGVAYACTLPALLRLGAGAGPLPAAEPAFSLAQLGPPDAACARPEAARALCESDWSHFGAEAGLFDTAPATTPGGERGPRSAGAPVRGGESDGCAVGVAQAGRWARAALVAAALGLGRAARAVRRASRGGGAAA